MQGGRDLLRQSIKPEATAIGFVCAYELGGLAGVWPTWTALVHKLPRSARLTVVAAVSVYLTVHFHCVALSRDA